ncbi:MAG: ComEC/Rec2 family competence protein [Coriobacteriales bacterium]|jgi:competence protein ComEC
MSTRAGRKGICPVCPIVALVLALSFCLAGCAPSQVGGSAADAVSNRPARDVDGELVVRFIDVGQGDCALLSCDGHHVLIDGGPRDASRKVYSIVRDIGVGRFDAIVASHPDVDHIGGISAALNAAGCDACYCSTWDVDTSLRTFSSLFANLEKAGVTLAVPEPGDTVEFGDAVLTFVGPVRQLEGDNDNSLVCRVDFGETSFLFTGDAEAAEEESLLSARADLAADVLKVAHHGSRSSSTPAFLKAVDPQYAVISVGAGNDYGHPKEQVLDRLAKAGAAIYRTDLDGSVIMKSDGSSIAVTTTSYVSE